MMRNLIVVVGLAALIGGGIYFAVPYLPNADGPMPMPMAMADGDADGHHGYQPSC